MFGPKPIHQLVEEQLRHAQESLLDAEAKLDHAQSVLIQHEANVKMYSTRVARLQVRVDANTPATDKVSKLRAS